MRAWQPSGQGRSRAGRSTSAVPVPPQRPVWPGRRWEGRGEEGTGGWARLRTAPATPAQSTGRSSCQPRRSPSRRPQLPAGPGRTTRGGGRGPPFSPAAPPQSQALISGPRSRPGPQLFPPNSHRPALTRQPPAPAAAIFPAQRVTFCAAPRSDVTPARRPPPRRRSDGAERRHRDRRARIGREVNPHRAGLERHRRAPTARETVVRARPAGQAPSRPAPRNAPHRFSLTSLSQSKTQQGWLVFSSPKYKIPSDESAPPPPLAQQHPPFPPQEDFGGRLPPHSSSKRTPSNTVHPSIFCDGRVGWGLPSVSTAAEKETALLNCNVKKKTTTGELQLSLMGQFHHRSTSVGVRGVRGRRRGCWKGEILLTEKARVWHAEGFLKLVGKRVVGRRVKTQRSSCDFFFSYTVVLKTVRAPHSSYFSTVRISDTTLALGAQHSCVTE